jgi:hypothetical protein
MQLGLLEKPTKFNQVKRLLIDRGFLGVYNYELNPISYRYGAVIHKLRKEGYIIKTEQLSRNGLFKFTMLGKA